MLQVRKVVYLGVGLAAGLISAPAFAEVTAQLGAGFTYDDNLFRESKEFSDLSGQERSDRIYSLTGEAAAHVTPGDFDGTLTVDAGHNWYDRNSSLNNFNYTAQLDLVRKSLDGIGVNVTGLSERTLSSFADVRQPIRNVQELNRFDAEVTLPVTAEFRLVVDPDFTQDSSSSQLLKFNDFRQYGVRAGVGWYTPLGNSIALTVTRRYTDGLHDRPVTLGDGSTVDGKINLVDTSFDIKLIYAVSPFTTIQAFASYVDRNDKSVLNSDYHGPAGSVTITYAPRDTLSFQLIAGRRLEAQSFLFVDSVRTDFVTLNGATKIAQRFDLQLAANYYRRRYDYDAIYTLGQQAQIDNDYRIDADLGYQLTDALRLSVHGAHEWRTSSIAFGSFHDTSLQFSLSYAFGRGATIGTNASANTNANVNRFGGVIL